MNEDVLHPVYGRLIIDKTSGMFHQKIIGR
jgi:hypothetical protein